MSGAVGLPGVIAAWARRQRALTCGGAGKTSFVPAVANISWSAFDEGRVDRKLYLTCLWPGLPELWWRGRLGALPTAIAFAAAVNFLLVARFLYPEWLTLALVRLAGWVGVAVWLFCVQRSVREMPGLLSPRAVSDRPDRFVEAHQAYLRAKWPEAESLLSDCLMVESRDPPAMLLLAGVYRHTGRLEAAERLLEEVRCVEAADRWWLEVEAESKRLQRDGEYRSGSGRAAAADDRSAAAEDAGRQEADAGEQKAEPSEREANAGGEAVSSAAGAAVPSGDAGELRWSAAAARQEASAKAA